MEGKEPEKSWRDNPGLIEEAEELKKLFEGNGYMMLSFLSPYQNNEMEVCKNGISSDPEGPEYQAIASLSPLDGKRRSCKKRETLLRQVEELCLRK